MDGAHIVVVDDDPEIRSMLEQLSARNGARVTSVATGKGLRDAMAGSGVDLVLLDINLGGESGLDLARALRDQCDTPILMLSAAGEPVDRIVGIELGADDYVVKPFHPRELLGRVRNLLRRSRTVQAPQIRLEFSQGTLDLAQRALRRRDGSMIRLTPGEVALLRVFVTNPGSVLSREQLLEQADGREQEPDRTIDLRIARLRRKLQPAAGGGPELIRTVRGRGYVFVDEREDEGAG